MCGYDVTLFQLIEGVEKGILLHLQTNHKTYLRLIPVRFFNVTKKRSLNWELSEPLSRFNMRILFSLTLATFARPDISVFVDIFDLLGLLKGVSCTLKKIF